jgi:hypothetical protein
MVLSARVVEPRINSQLRKVRVWRNSGEFRYTCRSGIRQNAVFQWADNLIRHSTLTLHHFDLESVTQRKTRGIFEVGSICKSLSLHD